MKETQLSTERIYDGKIIKLRKDTVILEDGKTAYREIISHGGGACVLAYLDGKILLEKQFRYAYNEELYEIPAGKREKGEDFKVTATRELEEETGYIPLDLKEIVTVYPTPGYTDEIIKIFYAENFEKGKINLDEDESVTATWVDFDKAYGLIESGEIKDSKTLIALQWLKIRIKEQRIK